MNTENKSTTWFAVHSHTLTVYTNDDFLKMLTFCTFKSVLQGDLKKKKPEILMCFYTISDSVIIVTILHKLQQQLQPSFPWQFFFFPPF